MGNLEEIFRNLKAMEGMLCTNEKIVIEFCKYYSHPNCSRSCSYAKLGGKNNGKVNPADYDIKWESLQK